MHMRFNTLIIRITTILLLAQAWTGSAMAWSQKPMLNKQMGYSDVLQLWGAPIEKIEKETKRQDVWRYADAKVIFNKGRVVAWSYNDDNSATSPLNTPEIESAEPSLVDDSQVEDILKDIMAGDPSVAIGTTPSSAVPLQGSSAGINIGTLNPDAQVEAGLMKMLP
jgi:hypothetical protein